MIEASKSEGVDLSTGTFTHFLKLSEITFLGIDFLLQKQKAITATKLYSYEDEDQICLSYVRFTCSYLNLNLTMPGIFIYPWANLDSSFNCKLKRPI